MLVLINLLEDPLPNLEPLPYPFSNHSTAVHPMARKGSRHSEKRKEEHKGQNTVVNT